MVYIYIYVHSSDCVKKGKKMEVEENKNTKKGRRRLKNINRCEKKTETRHQIRNFKNNKEESKY